MAAPTNQQNDQRGIVLLALLVLVVIGIAVAAFLFVAKAQKTDDTVQGALPVLRRISS